jgi:hypothetical protein
MRSKSAALFVLLFELFAGFSLAGQRYVDPTNTYHRVYAVVPVLTPQTVTALQYSLPKYAPTPDEIGKKSGIYGFSSMLSDDGKFALIELVAHERATLLPVLNDPSIQAFEKGGPRQTNLIHEIEAAFQLHKKGFTMSQFDEVSAR